MNAKAETGTDSQIGKARPFAYAQDLLFVSAQSGGSEATDWSVAAQTRAALARLTRILAQAKASASDVVQVGIFYHQSLLDQEKDLIRQVRSAFDAELAPVLTAIPLHNLPGGSSVQIDVIALRPGSRRWQSRKAVGATTNSFSSAMRCDDVVFIGAQMAKDAKGCTLHPNDIVSQAKVTMANIKGALNEVGADLPSVAKLNTYYVGHGTAEDWATAARIRSDAFKKPGPGGTGVPIPGPYPADLLLRQEAIAIVDNDGAPARRETSWPEGIWDWPIPVSFEQGLRLNNLLVLGGQIAATTTGEALYPGDLGAQAVKTMQNIKDILAEFNSGVDDLAKLSVFYATKGDAADITTVMEAIHPFFSHGLPALTLVPLATLALEGLEIEIDGIGAVGIGLQQPR